MHFEYEIPPDEFVASQLLYYKLSRGRKRILNAVGSTLLGLLLIVVAWDERAVDSVPFLLAILGAWFIYMGVVWSFPSKYFRRAYQKGELAGKKYQADLNQDGFEVAGDLRSWRVRWEGVRLKGENEQVFILYSAGTLFMFGKKYLSNEQQQELRRLSGLM
jgi:hypothetical protein